MDKEYILLDLDGTITDSKEGIVNSFKYSLNSFGINILDFDDLSSLIGPPLIVSFRERFGLSENDARRAVIKYREYYSEKGIFENELYTGVDVLLKELKDKGKSIILATSKAAIYAKQILIHFSIDNYFSFVGGSELDGSRLTKSEVIKHVMEECNIAEPSKAIMVGDREHDIIGAREHGMDSVGVLYGYGSQRELSDAGASYIAENIDELYKLLTAPGKCLSS